MKKLLLIVALLATTMLANSQSVVVIDNQRPQNSSVEILEETDNWITLKLNVNSYSLSEVQTPNGTEVVVGAPDGINYMEKGIPDVPYFATSVRIPAKGKAIAEIVDANYITVNNISIAPSKGSISRKVDPATVPYEYGKCYSIDAFVPANEAINSKAFCIRDVRGTTVRFFPFQYNPVQKQLKVFTEITVKVKFTQQPSENEIAASYEKIDEFENIYNRLFINYGSKKRYTQLQDGHPGRMLIICKDTYQSAMREFIAWKREKGIETEMVLMSAIGTTATNVQSYITNYFNEHSDLAYILLVGDGGDVPSNVSSGSGWMAESQTSDNQYAYLVGNDHYADVFIGRFSGQSVADISNMVRKVILYEKELTTDDTWLTNGYGSASNEGGGNSGGHNQGNGNESDMTHMGYIQTDLENYGYTVTRVNQASSGYTSDVAATSAAFNAGVGLACYIGHGDVQEWASTGYRNSNVNALTNENKQPFIISVACVNGDFNGNTCFAEAWLRASKNGNPTGALAFLGSTINQDWDPPMTAQDEMIDIIVESLDGNIKRTIGGITFNGYFRMIQDFPANSSSGDGVATADTWIIFGDPSTMFRSKTPQEMTVSHPSVLTVGQSSIDVSSTADETLIAITRVVDGEVVILGAGYANNGNATINLAELTEPCTVKITATAYNKVTYQQEIMVIVPDGPYIVNGGFTIVDNEGNNNGAADYNETIKLNYTLNNVGVQAANNVSMSISSSSDDVTVTDSEESFGNIAANGSETKNNAFSMSIRNGVADQTNIPVSYTITSDNCESRSGSFTITANAPAPAISFVRVDDSENGNRDGLIDGGETIKVIFNVANNGHSRLPAGTATLTVDNVGVSIISNEAQIRDIDAGNSQNVQFEVAIAENIETKVICFTVQNSGTYSSNIMTFLPVGRQIEDWESNTFDTYEWQNNSSVPWTIVSTGAYEGQYCAKSGSIEDNANTDLIITVDVLKADNVEFYKKVSCEAPGSSWWNSEETYYDYLAFYIDDNMKGQWAGTTDNWSLQTYPVSAGTHTLKWSYVKDDSQNSGSDCAWIDNIKLPVHAKSVVSIHTNIVFAENTMDIYPNPASDNVYININLAKDSNVSIEIYNVVGQLVKTIDSTNLQSGENYFAVESSTFKAGMYIVKANIGGSVITKNLSIIK